MLSFYLWTQVVVSFVAVFVPGSHPIARAISALFAAWALVLIFVPEAR